MLAAAVSKPDAHAGELPIAYVQLVAGARANADEIRDFAAAHIPERAAAPKEIVIVDKMPLTDVGKPAKVQLRNDAARRAFQALLADVAEPAKLMVDDGGRPDQGQRGAHRGRGGCERRRAATSRREFTSG